ncbi:MAG: hypothetical protein AAGK26_17945 [Pseudomonadota bacterium]
MAHRFAGMSALSETGIALDSLIILPEIDYMADLPGRGSGLHVSLQDQKGVARSLSFEVTKSGETNNAN